MAFIFTYGTLRRGERNHVRLGPRAIYQGNFNTVSKYRTVLMQFEPKYMPIPIMLDDPKGEIFNGEVWWIPNYQKYSLDKFEGAPYLYQRKPILLDGFENAECYFPVLASFKGAKIVKS